MRPLLQLPLLCAVLLAACGVETEPNPNYRPDAGDSGGSGGDSGTGGSGATGGDAAVDSGLDGAVDSGSDADVDAGADSGPMLPCGVACGGSTPYCDTTSMTCVACLSTAQCGDDVCDLTTHTCVNCTATEGCDASTVCNVANRTCVECVGLLGCESPEVCDNESNTCVACNTNIDCNSASLVCLTDGHSCVECNVTTDCDGTDKCKPSTNTCEQCLADTDCTSPGAAKCNLTTNTCVPCDDNTQCTGVMDGATALGVCSAGTCAQCTVTNETACGGNSCNPATRRCTTTPRTSVGTCGACLADSECSNAQARCIPMNFNGTPRPGGYCLRQKGNTDCARPFGVLINAASLSGEALQDYCGISQTRTTCEAVLDMLDSADCGGDDSACGALGLDDGRCETVGGFANKCTYGCGGNVALCSEDFTCTVDEPYCH